MMENLFKRILVISPTPSHPQNAGNRSRIFSFLSNMKEKKCDIHFCYLDVEGKSFHVKNGPDKEKMAASWDKFIYVPFLPPKQLKLSANYILYTSNILSDKNRSLSSVLKRKFYLFFNFFPSGSGLNYLLLKFIDYFFNIALKILSDLREKNHWSYYFMRSKYRSLQILLKGEITPRVFLKTFFSLKYTEDKETFEKRVETEDKCVFSIDDWYNNGLDEIIKQLHAKYHYTAVIAEYVFMSKALLNFDDTILKIIDTHDLFTNRHLIYSNAGISDTFFSTTCDEESKGLDRADLVLAIQDKERIQFETMTQKQVITIGHKLVLTKPIPRVKGRYNILYIGSGNTSNTKGIQNFIANVLPSVLSAVPDAVLLIAGNVCKTISQTPGCLLMGEIEDIHSAYARADLVINPAAVGTGLKIKNIEALGFSKPMVTTHHSAEGIHTDHNAFFMAATDEEFSHYIIRLLRDDILYSEMSKNAYRTAQDYNLSIDRKLDQIMTIHNKVRLATD